MNFSFTKADRILKRNEFIQLSKFGRKLQNEYFIAYYAPGRFDRSRLGVTVTRKYGRAVKRNRMKRLIREYFRLNRHLILGEWDINIIAKQDAADLSSEKIFGSLQNIFKEFLVVSDNKKLITLPFLSLIRAYQYFLSPVVGPTCRFYPSCSDYAYQAIRRYGPLKGFLLALKRLLRCHPFNPGGVDPVP